MELSVIVPVYNAESTIRRCLESIEQIDADHRSEMEVICIDDGSTDCSRQIIDTYCAGDQLACRRTLTKVNGGSASARNCGLEVARGTWLLFLDSDDELCCDPLAHIRAHGRSATALLFSVELHRDERFWTRRQPPRISAKSHLDVMTAGNPLHPSSLVFRRLCAAHPLDETLISREDWHFWAHNPGIFERPVRLPGVTSSIIHAHGANKSCDQARAGRFRQRVAEILLEQQGKHLTRRQRNNLQIQRRIGQIQQGQSIEIRRWLGTWFRWPCNWILWLKLLVYAVLGRRLRRFDFYG